MGPQDQGRKRDRETILRATKSRPRGFREQLAGPQGVVARRLIATRGVTPATVELLGIGYAPALREALKTKLLREGVFPLNCSRGPDWFPNGMAACSSIGFATG